MHMQGTPETMQAAPRYDDVVTEVELFADGPRRRPPPASAEPDLARSGSRLR
jgi:hypothetical protein